MCWILPKGSCLLMKRERSEMKKSEIFSELGPYKSIRKKTDNVYLSGKCNDLKISWNAKDRVLTIYFIL